MGAYSKRMYVDYFHYGRLRLIFLPQSLSCAYTEYGISPLAHILLPCSKSTCLHLLNLAPSFRGWSSTVDPCRHCCIQTLAMIFEITRNVLLGLVSPFHFRSVCSDDCWIRGLKQPRTTSMRTEVDRVSLFDGNRDVEPPFFSIRSGFLFNSVLGYLLHAYFEYTAWIVAGNEIFRSRCTPSNLEILLLLVFLFHPYFAPCLTAVWVVFCLTFTSHGETLPQKYSSFSMPGNPCKNTTLFDE